MCLHFYKKFVPVKVLLLALIIRNGLCLKICAGENRTSEIRASQGPPVEQFSLLICPFVLEIIA